MSENFWEHVNIYRKLGFDPLRWIPSCSNEVDIHVLKAALSEVKHSRIKVSPSWYDCFYHIEGKIPELTRRVYSFANPVIDKEVELKRALAVFRIHTGSGEHAPLLTQALENFFKIFNSKVSVTSVSAVLTEHKDAEFGMLDYIQLHRGDKIGYMPAVTSVTQVTDITKAPDADLHSNIAMTSAIELLNLLGCDMKSSPSSKLFPIYDAPSEEMLDKIRSNLDAFTSRYNIALEDYSSLKLGKLFYGTSAIATTTKELPTRYDQIEEGMEIIITNKFGGLSELGLYTLACLDSESITKYEQQQNAAGGGGGGDGISFANITQAKDEALKNLSEPHFALGKIIAKYCPDFGSAYDKQAHITAVYPVGSQGIFALGALAELANAQLMINELPVRNEEIAKFATDKFLIENATASLNGCHIIIATKDVANLITEELSKHNFAPQRIGLVEKKGSSLVTFAIDVSQFVASKVKLARLVGIPPQHDTSTAAPPSPPAPPSHAPPSSPTSSEGSAVS
ncbi:MAG TPA: SelD-related putative sulfur metabolism protein [Nitrososphaera sp.]|nr:SelD-related putative sulfur metabolism protein [Nitrososphaera sp.]